MKATLVLTLLALQVSANTLAQKITLSEKNASIDRVFDQIRLQTGYDFLVTKSVLRQASPVSLTVKDRDLKEVLAEIFKDQPLDYVIGDKIVVVKLKEQSFLARIKDILTAIDVTGRVVDEIGQPLSGATVRSKTGNNLAITDALGNFTLKKVQPNEVLLISFVGYDPKEVAAQPGLGTIELHLTVSALNQVQVIAYGTTTERTGTGSVVSVKSSELETQPVTNPMQALESKVPGLKVIQQSGIPGSGLTIEIRGRNSLVNGNSPLFVLDGVMLQPEGDQYGTNPFSSINLEDIASISVLKDADATAIYGSRGANGVILITTKKGKAGPTKIEASVSSGASMYGRTQPLLNTQQYLEMRKEALANDSVIADANSAPDLFGFGVNADPNRYTNWKKALIGQTSTATDVQTSASGGNANTNFLIGASYHRESAPFPGSFYFQRPTVHFNLDHASDNKKFKLLLNGNYGVVQKLMPLSDPTAYDLYTPPNAPPQKNPDGSPLFNPMVTNPYAVFLQTQSLNTKTLIANGSISYQLFPSLQLRSTFGYTSYQNDQQFKQPLSSYDPAWGYTSGSAVFSTIQTESWQIEPQLEYTKAISKGKLSILAGSTFMGSTSSSTVNSETKFPSDLALDDPSAGTPSITAAYAKYRYAALFGRINYNWADKYLLNLSARRDGSSRFGPDNRFANFGAAGAGWVFSEEKALRGSFLSYGKLRGSYGLVGNDQIGDYKYYDSYSRATSQIGIVGIPLSYAGIAAFNPTSLVNPYYGWESTKKLEFGLELGVFKDRILLGGTWYRSRSSNLLLYNALAPTTGFPGIFQNLPATVQNNGLEFTLNTINLKGGAFTWNTEFNITVPHNKLVRYDGLDQSAYANAFVIGQPINIRKVFHYTGVDPQTGIYTFVDAQGKATANPAYVTDQQTVINLDRKFYGGFSNTFNYKSLSLAIDFQFVNQKGANPQALAPGDLANQSTTVLSRWQKPGDITSQEKFTATFGTPAYTAFFYAQQSSWAYVNASYIRLKNLSLAYHLLPKWINHIGVRDAKVFLNGQNLWTITNYKGNDPENLGYSVLPPLKTVIFGIKASF